MGQIKNIKLHIVTDIKFSLEVLLPRDPRNPKMLVLFETAAGYAVFKLLDEKKLSQVDNLYQDFQTADKASEVVKLQMFKKFEDTTEALAAATASIEGKMSKSLKKLLKKVASKELQEELAVADAKVGKEFARCTVRCSRRRRQHRDGNSESCEDRSTHPIPGGRRYVEDQWNREVCE